MRKKACVEEGPEPGNEEHHFRRDEHDHAVAQVQRHDARVMPLMGFLDRVGPPGEHRVEHEHEADEEDPGIGEVHAEQIEGLPGEIAHVGHATESHDEGTDGGQQRPRARVDDVIVMLFAMGVCHVVLPRISVPPRRTGALLMKIQSFFAASAGFFASATGRVFSCG